MENIIRQCVGIDCAKDELVCCLAVFTSGLDVQVISNGVFENNAAGISKLISWAEKAMVKDHELYYIVEATGVYHEQLAYAIAGGERKISVVLPKKTHMHMESLNMKTVTDKTAAFAIADYGLKNKLRIWKRPDPLIILIRDLMREKEQIIDDTTAIKNQIHAESASERSNQKRLGRMRERLQVAERQLREVMKDAREAIKQNKELKKKIDNICTIPGVAMKTALTIVGETQGFSIIENSRQLVSYAGLDIRVKDSGTSVKSKPRISRRGNRHIRKALYFPAHTAARYNPNHAALYARLVGKHSVKMKASVAVQRKVLVLIYTIWKKNEPFNENYGEDKIKKSEGSSLNPPTELVQDRSNETNI